MICQVSVDPEGAVTVVVDSDDALDEDAQKLQGLTMDAMCDRAAATAIAAWFELRGGKDDGGDGE